MFEMNETSVKSDFFQDFDKKTELKNGTVVF